MRWVGEGFGTDAALLVEGELDDNGCGRVPKPELHGLPLDRGEHRDRGVAVRIWLL